MDPRHNPAIEYDTWKSTAQTRATDGTYRSTQTASATATIAFSGTSITVLGTKNAHLGHPGRRGRLHRPVLRG